MLKIKNPWAHRPWKGRFSPADRLTWTKGLKHLLLGPGTSISTAGDDDDDDDGGGGGNVGGEEQWGKIFDKMEAQGVFWMEFRDTMEYFTGLFVNWNPELFKYRTSAHGRWHAILAPIDDRYYRGENPQYCLVFDDFNLSTTTAGTSSTMNKQNPTELQPQQTKTTPVWLLLTRHVTTRDAWANNVYVRVLCFGYTRQGYVYV